uniref:Uncharacterized protein n=1 Tax=Prolemur simus TaxID=1328070 RepID=A0A8C8YZD0_PROSS
GKTGCGCFQSPSHFAVSFNFGPEFPSSSTFINMHYYAPNNFLTCIIWQLLHYIDKVVVATKNLDIDQ